MFTHFAFLLELTGCHECKSPVPNEPDHLSCDKCKKSYHWQCTKLEKHIIKLYKKNPYKPWRCPSCVDKYCIDCNKTFPENNLDSINCDKCSYWYHLNCSELSDQEFKSFLSNPSKKWVCKPCIKKYCKKCDISVHHKSKISCCLCHHTFHFSCVNLPASSKNDGTTDSWLCQNCTQITFPYASESNKTVISLSNTKLDKYSLEKCSSPNYSNTCNVCKKKLNKNNSGFPCSSCKTNIHAKCCTIKKQDFHLCRGNWQCDTCLAELQIPFTFIDQDSLLELTFNSAHTSPEKKFIPEVSIEDKLKLMLSYSKQSPWYTYTHPHENDYDFFNTDLDELYSNKQNFDYYDVDCFRNRKTLE